MSESIIKLYAAVLLYLSKAKSYFSGNTLSMFRSIILPLEKLQKKAGLLGHHANCNIERFGKAIKDTLFKQYDELLKKISESEIEKWTRVADRERE